MRALRATKQEVADLRVSALTTKQQLEATMEQQRVDAAAQLDVELRDQRTGLDLEITKLRSELDRAMLRIGELQLQLSQAPRASEMPVTRSSLLSPPSGAERKQKPIVKREKKSSTAGAFEGIDEHEISTMSPREVMHFLVRYINKEKIRVQDLYQEWDLNNSGSISRDEFHHAIDRIGTQFPAPTVDGIFDVIVDKDPRGVLTYENLIKAIRKTKQEIQLQDSARLQAESLTKKLSAVTAFRKVQLVCQGSPSSAASLSLDQAIEPTPVSTPLGAVATEAAANRFSSVHDGAGFSQASGPRRRVTQEVVVVPHDD